MGSAFTSYRAGMDRVLSDLSRLGLVFVDSRTTGDSIVAAAAATSGTAMTGRDVFLDHDPRLDAVKAQLRKVETIARKFGSAVAIGHPNDATMTALEAWIPLAKSRGFEFVPVRDIIARRHCATQPESATCDPAIYLAEVSAPLAASRQR